MGETPKNVAAVFRMARQENAARSAAEDKKDRSGARADAINRSHRREYQPESRRFFTKHM
jgi:hypothetical protein